MNYPVGLSDRFTFGKHRGDSIREVIEQDAEYIAWCIENVDNFELNNQAYAEFQKHHEDY